MFPSILVLLRRENQEWTARFRGEARSRSTVLDMQRTMQGIDHDRQSAEHALEQAHLNLEHADRRARKKDLKKIYLRNP